MKNKLEDNLTDNELIYSDKTENILQNLSIDEVNKSLNSCNENTFMKYQTKTKRIDNQYNNDQEISINENNQSKYSNLLDNSFVRVNNKIDEFKNSIKEKIRVMKNNNLIYSNNSNNNNRVVESCSKNDYSNNRLTSTSVSQSQRTYSNYYCHDVPSHSQVQSQNDFIIFNSFRKRLEKKGDISPDRERESPSKQVSMNYHHDFNSNSDLIQNQSNRVTTEGKKEKTNFPILSPIQIKSNIVDTLEYKLSEEVYPIEKIQRNNTNTNFNSSIEKEYFHDIDKIINNKDIVKKENDFQGNRNQKKNLNKSKYFTLLNKYRKKRRELKEKKNSLNKLRKINQFLKYKNYFELVKQVSTNSNSNQNINSIKTTQITSEEKEDKKMSMKLLLKIEENIKTFEQLEKEIMSKDKLISNLNLIIESQKKTIDKLVEHYDLIYKNTVNEDNKVKNELMKIINFGSSFEQSLIKVEEPKEEKLIQNTLINSFQEKEIKVQKDTNRTLDRKQNSINTLSYNLSKSLNDKEDLEDCSVFLTSQKAGIDITETTSQVVEEKSLKLADLTSYENLKRNSFLESQINYKLLESNKTPSYSEDVLKKS